MKKIIIYIIIVLLTSSFSFADNYAYVETLFKIRTTIMDHGKELPSQMQKATGNDVRTLERIFELNTSALTTIEAYFRILEIAIASEKSININIITILNEWLEFINAQCYYDLEFIDEALNETKNISIIHQLKTAKNNIRRLADTSSLAISQNNLLKSGN